MATIQVIDRLISLEPRHTTPEIDFGPMDAISADSVLITTDNLKKVGAQPPRCGQDFVCLLWVVDSISGVETFRDISGYTLTGTYWDPVSRVANTLTVALGSGTGDFTITFADTDSLTAGMYRFQVTATETDVFELCSGWIEITPEIPS